MSGLKRGHGKEGVEKKKKKGSLVVPMDCTLYGAGQIGGGSLLRFVVFICLVLIPGCQIFFHPDVQR